VGGPAPDPRVELRRGLGYASPFGLWTIDLTMRRLLSLFGLFALLWLAAAAPAQVQEAPRGAWEALVARDARVGFGPRTALLASEVLRSSDAAGALRAAAWLALGSVGAGELAAQLEQTARGGSEPERAAAILALGERGQGSASTLLELAQSDDLQVAATALLALLRTRDPNLRRVVEELARKPSDPRAALAAQLLIFAADPAHSEPVVATRLLLELRWRAAREFGLVDGQTWMVLVCRALGQRADFRSAVILRAAARIDRPGVRDLLLGALLHGEGQGRLRAAARGMPRELALLVQNQLWRPANLGEWTAIFDELEQGRLEAYAPEVFEAALSEPALKARALDLYSRSGAQDLSGAIEEALAGASTQDRVLLCRAMGESEDSAYRQRLAALATSREPSVRAAALVAGLLLGSRPADAALRAGLAQRDDPLRAALLLELAANTRSASALALLEDEFKRASEPERRVIGPALAREGLRDARVWCREALASRPPRPAEALRVLVAALRVRLSSEDLDVVRGLFPREDTDENLALNVELALALVELGDPSASLLLQSALWNGDLEVSLLSGALLAQVSGMHALRAEAANPPASASSADVRRAGFALGLWGGLPELEALAQALRYNSGAPALQGGLLGFLSTRTQ